MVMIMEKDISLARKKQVLLALDCSDLAEFEFKRAVHLAALVEAELQTLFIESSALIRVSELPFTREFAFGSAQTRSTSAEMMTSSLQQFASLVKSQLAHLAQLEQVVCSFNSVRGEFADLLLLHQQNVDFIITGHRRHKPALNPAVCLVYDGSPAAERALQAALSLTCRNGHKLIIYGKNINENKIRKMASQDDTALHISIIAQLPELDSLLEEKDLEILFLPMTMLTENLHAELLAKAKMPLVLVR